MKKIIAVFGSLLFLVNTKSNAQNPQQPVKKETVKPTNGPAPKAEANDQFIKLGGVKKASVIKGANPNFIKGASPSTQETVAPRHTPPPASKPIAPRH